jgi:hypothetical protein
MKGRGLVAAALLLTLACGERASRDAITQLHASLRPGMQYREFVAMAESRKSIWFACLDATTTNYPPCRRLHVRSQAGGEPGWQFQLEVGSTGALQTIGAVEHAD